MRLRTQGGWVLIDTDEFKAAVTQLSVMREESISVASAIAASLVPMHYVGEASHPLPYGGSITLGSRPNRDVVCVDFAVSGTHCIIHRMLGPGLDWVEVEDCSTNGTYVNDTKLQEGEKLRINNGEVLTLTQPDAMAAGANVQRRIAALERRSEPVQFRLEALGVSVGPCRPCWSIVCRCQ